MIVTAPGFKKFIRQNVVVSAGNAVRVDAQLQIGQVTEQSEVSAALSQIPPEEIGRAHG